MKILNANFNSCICSDNDINVISTMLEKNNKFNSTHKKIYDYIYFDYTKPLNKQIDNVVLNYFNTINSSYIKKFDTIMAINTIHYAFTTKEYQIQFFNNIELISNSNCNIIIRFLDYDNLKSIFGEKFMIKSAGVSFVSKEENNDLNKIYYDWCHQTPIKEKVLTKKILQNAFKNKNENWKCVEYISNINEHQHIQNQNDYTNWNLYFKCFSTIIFSKM